MFMKVIGKACKNPQCEFKDKLKEEFAVMCECGQALDDVTVMDTKKVAALIIIILVVLCGGGYAGYVKLSSTWTHIPSLPPLAKEPDVGQVAKVDEPPPPAPPAPDPKVPIRLVSQGLNLVKENKFQEAETVFRTASLKDPTNDQAFGNLGAVCTTLGKHEEALAASLKAIDLNPNNPLWRLNAAELYAMKGETDKALSAIDAAIKSGFKDKTKIRSFNFKKIENDPRFRELRSVSMNMRHFQQIFSVPRHRSQATAC